MFKRISRTSSGADRILDNVIRVLKDYKLNLVVRGHTDDRPISTRKFPSNWELSAARAAVALDYIVNKGDIEISRAKAVGYADTRPSAPMILQRTEPRINV